MLEMINLIDLNHEQKKMILGWRNHPDVRKWMYSKDIIAYDEHIAFLNSLHSRKDEYYFLIKKNKQYIGVIDLKDEFLGIYANPNMSRVGDVLLRTIIEFAFKTKKISSLKAEVYKNNIKAIKLYKRFGFVKNKENEDMILFVLLKDSYKISSKSKCS